MSQHGNLRLIIAVGILIAVYILTRWVIAWRMNRASRRILEGLKEQKAFDGASAVRLPFAERSWAKFGMRDYEGKALQGLVSGGAVGETVDGRYFLKGARHVL